MIVIFEEKYLKELYEAWHYQWEEQYPKLNLSKYLV